ncbi:MAG: hypothetical protein IJR65_03305 [Oscillospiraceae bacterium]|nr:hypothetical protein [Oscillospiraceae bacterium]
MVKTWIRMGLTLILVLTALVMALKCAATFRERPVTESGEYLLGAAEGRVAVYDLFDRREALTVTDIELSTLRERDRELLEAGIPAESREELMALLEDLGG